MDRRTLQQAVSRQAGAVVVIDALLDVLERSAPDESAAIGVVRRERERAMEHLWRLMCWSEVV